MSGLPTTASFPEQIRYLAAENAALRDLLARMEERLAEIEHRHTVEDETAPRTAEERARILARLHALEQRGAPAAAAAPAPAPAPVPARTRATPADTRKDFEAYLTVGETVYTRYKGTEYTGRFHLRTHGGRAGARMIARRHRDTERIGAITLTFLDADLPAGERGTDDYVLSPSAFCCAVKRHVNGDEGAYRSPGWDEVYVIRDGVKKTLAQLRTADERPAAAAAAADDEADSVASAESEAESSDDEEDD